MTPIIHLNPLYPSPRAVAVMVRALEPRFLEVCGAYARKHGEELEIPADLDADMLRWRELNARHRRGDYRNTADEAASLARIAQWTLDTKMDLCDQPRQQIDWGRAI